MSTQPHPAAGWIYRGVWGVLVGLFRVPRQPPALPVASGGKHESFQPSAGYLGYLKFKFWVVLVLAELGPMALGVGGIVALVMNEEFGWAGGILIPAILLIVVPAVVGYIAIHLRYDTMWYVLTDRSLRIRRGIWVIHEMTITFENVQNVTVQQGPVERFFGIASVVVDTAGGSSPGPHNHSSITHRGMVEGIGNAPEIRDLILARVRASTSAGLGDDHGQHRGANAARHSGGAAETAGVAAAGGWSAEHIAALRAIRDEARALARPAAP